MEPLGIAVGELDLHDLLLEDEKQAKPGAVGLAINHLAAYSLLRPSSLGLTNFPAPDRGRGERSRGAAHG
jgi:hypothetical protein